MKILLTGATGKVGTRFLQRFFEEERFSDGTVRALCHNRLLEETSRLEVISGSIADRELVGNAMEDVTHVIHLATCKETPEQVMDVTVKGLFWLLEECRLSESFQQFVLIGGDAAMGHFFYPHPVPVTETQKHSPYPGCYALSKVLEEVMLEQYYTQYDLNGCCLRAPWIMEKDDFKYSLDEVIERRELILNGQSQFVEFLFVPPKGIEKANLKASIEDRPGEVALENNEDKHGMQIIDEKINVLYVEGMPRWEYRYLRWVLLRDPRLNVRFLMTQGDKYLAATSPRHLGVFPSEAEEMLTYDLVILGDVSASFFTNDQIRWMEELVKGRELGEEDNGSSLVGGGGSLLMLGGQVASPSSYFNSRIADVLPVKMDSTSRQWYHGSSYPVVTPDGLESSVVSLHPEKEKNDQIWRMVSPMGFMNGLTAKPGATVLLSRSGNEPTSQPYPLVAWQRYGKGKSMYVGTDDLWRLRREVGDQFHARFWGQAIQFLALSRKLGQNKQVTLETSRKQYSTGERLELFANVLTENFDPVDYESYSVLLDRNGSVDYPIEVSLDPVPGSPGLYGTSILATEPGSYALKAGDSDALKANVVEFEVDRLSLEQRETSMRDDLADQLASLTGGNRLVDFSGDDSDGSGVSDLASLLPSKLPDSLPVEREKTLWDIPVIFLILVFLTGLEWYLRRRENLV